MVAVRGIPSGMPGFQVARSANLRTAATYHRVAAISGGSITYLELHMFKETPNPPQTDDVSPYESLDSKKLIAV
jgi:hypothetical protein